MNVVILMFSISILIFLYIMENKISTYILTAFSGCIVYIAIIQIIKEVKSYKQGLTWFSTTFKNNCFDLLDKYVSNTLFVTAVLIILFCVVLYLTRHKYKVIFMLILGVVSVVAIVIAIGYAIKFNRLSNAKVMYEECFGKGVSSNLITTLMVILMNEIKFILIPFTMSKIFNSKATLH